jgi:hypothetical protein
MCGKDKKRRMVRHFLGILGAVFLWGLCTLHLAQAEGITKESQKVVAEHLGRLVWAIQQQPLRGEEEAIRQKESFEQLWRWVRAKGAREKENFAEAIWKEALAWMERQPVMTGDDAALKASAKDWLENRRLGGQDKPTEDGIFLKIGMGEAAPSHKTAWAWRKIVLLLMGEVFEEKHPLFSRMERRRVVVQWLPLWLKGSLLQKMRMAQEHERGFPQKTKALWRGVVIPFLLQEEGRLDRGLWRAAQSGKLPQEWLGVAAWLRESYQMLGRSLLFMQAPPLGAGEGKAAKSSQKPWRDLVAHPLFLAARHQALLDAGEMSLWGSLVQQAKERPEIALGGGLLMLKAFQGRMTPTQKAEALVLEEKLLRIIIEKSAGSLREKSGVQKSISWGWSRSQMQGLFREIGGWDAPLVVQQPQTGMSHLRNLAKRDAKAHWQKIQGQIASQIKALAKSKPSKISKDLENKIKETQRALKQTLENPFVLYGMVDAFYTSPPKGLEEALVVHWWMKHAMQREPALLGRALEEVGVEKIRWLGRFQRPEKVTWPLLLQEASRTTQIEALRGRWFGRSFAKASSPHHRYPENPWEKWSEADLFHKWRLGLKQQDTAEGSGAWLAWLGIPKAYEEEWSKGISSELAKPLRWMAEIGRLGRGFEADGERLRLVREFLGKPNIGTLQEMVQAWEAFFRSNGSAQLRSSMEGRIAFDLLWLMLQRLQGASQIERSALAVLLKDLKIADCQREASSLFSDKCVGLIAAKLSLQERDGDIPLDPREVRGYQRHPIHTPSLLKAEKNPVGLWGYRFWLAMWQRGLTETRFKRRHHLLIQEDDALDRAWKALEKMRSFVEQRTQITARWAGRWEAKKEAGAGLPVNAWPWSRSCVENETQDCSLAQVAHERLDGHRQDVEALGEQHDQLHHWIEQHRELNRTWPMYSPRFLREKVEAAIRELKAEEEAYKKEIAAYKTSRYQSDLLSLLRSPVAVAWKTYDARLNQAKARMLRAKELLLASQARVEEQQLLQQAESLLASLFAQQKKRLDLLKQIKEAHRKTNQTDRQIQSLRQQRAKLQTGVVGTQQEITAIDGQIKQIEMEAKKAQIEQQIQILALLQSEVEILEDLLVKEHRLQDKTGKTITVKGKIGELAHRASLRVEQLEKELRKKLQAVMAAKGNAQQREKVIVEAEQARRRWRIAGMVVGVVAAVAYAAVVVGSGGAALAALPTILMTSTRLLSLSASLGTLGGRLHYGVKTGQSFGQIVQQIMGGAPKIVSGIAAISRVKALFEKGRFSAFAKNIGRASNNFKSMEGLFQHLPKKISITKEILPAFQEAQEKTIPRYFGEEKQKRLACLLKHTDFWGAFFQAVSSKKRLKRLSKKEIVNFAKAGKSFCEDSERKDSKKCKKLRKTLQSCPEVVSEVVAMIDVTEWALAKAQPTIKMRHLLEFFLLFDLLRFLQAQPSFQGKNVREFLSQQLQQSGLDGKEISSRVERIMGLHSRYFEGQWGKALTWSFLEPKILSLLREVDEQRYPNLPEKTKAEEKIELLRRARRILDAGFFRYHTEKLIAKWKKDLEMRSKNLQEAMNMEPFQATGGNEKAQLEQQIQWFEKIAIPKMEKGLHRIHRLLVWLRSGGEDPALSTKLAEKRQEIKKEQYRLKKLLQERDKLRLQQHQVFLNLKVGETHLKGAKLTEQIEEVVMTRLHIQQESFEVISKQQERIEKEEFLLRKQQGAFKTAASQKRLEALKAGYRAARHRVEEEAFRLRAVEQEKHILQSTMQGLSKPSQVVLFSEHERLLKERLHRRIGRIRQKVAKVLHRLRAFEHHLVVCGFQRLEPLRRFTKENWTDELTHTKEWLLGKHRELSQSADVKHADIYLNQGDLEYLFDERGLYLQFHQTQKPKEIHRENRKILYEIRPARCRAVLWVGVVFGAGVNRDIMEAQPVRFTDRIVRSLEPLGQAEIDYRFSRVFRGERTSGDQKEFLHQEKLELIQDGVLDSSGQQNFFFGRSHFVNWLKGDAYFRDFAGLEHLTWRTLWGLPMSGALRLKVSSSKIPKKARLVWIYIDYPAQ